MRKILRRDEAVSPIIATILLVAITVTLISSAYSIFSGYIPASTPSSPSVTIEATNNTTIHNGLINGAYILTLSEISSNISLRDLSAQIVLQNGTSFEQPMYESYADGVSVPFQSGVSLNVSMPGGFLSSDGYILISLTDYGQYVSSFSIIDSASGTRVSNANL